MAEPPVKQTIDIVGVHGGECFGDPAREALRRATVVVGTKRHLDSLPAAVAARRMELGGDLDSAIVEMSGLAEAGERVCMVASGDPGFFGITRIASLRLEPERLRVHPAPSSVALAFARLRGSWDDAVVVSAHGRDPAAAVDTVASHAKVAVLVSPTSPPQEIAAELVARDCGLRKVHVLSHLGEQHETVWEGDLPALAAGSFDPNSVVVFTAPGPRDDGPGTSWGMPDETYQHRGGMITKAEVRAVALGKLALPQAGVLWDVGAGSGSVSAECARLAPGLRVFAVERGPDDLERLRANVASSGVTVVAGEAPPALTGLPDPDRVFVGGGGLEALDASLERLRPGGSVVATYASLERALAAAERLGDMVQVSVSRAVRTGGDGTFRLAAENPIFICWGTR